MGSRLIPFLKAVKLGNEVVAEPVPVEEAKLDEASRAAAEADKNIAKNVAVMLQALAQGAKPNWHNDEEEGRTALIQTIQAVRLHSLYMYIIMQVRVCCHYSKCVWSCAGVDDRS